MGFDAILVAFIPAGGAETVLADDAFMDDASSDERLLSALLETAGGCIGSAASGGGGLFRRCDHRHRGARYCRSLVCFVSLPSVVAAVDDVVDASARCASDDVRNSVTLLRFAGLLLLSKIEMGGPQICNQHDDDDDEEDACDGMGIMTHCVDSR